MITFLLSLSLLFQVPTFTPEPIGPTPTPTVNPTEQSWLDRAGDIQSTVEAYVEEPPLSTDGTQLYDRDGNPLLPDFSSPEMLTMFGYIKWTIDPANTRAVFGPFAPIINHLRIIFVLSIAWFGFYMFTRLLRLLRVFWKWLLNNALWIAIWSRILITIAVIYGIWQGIRAMRDRLAWISIAVDWLQIKMIEFGLRIVEILELIPFI